MAVHSRVEGEEEENIKWKKLSILVASKYRLKCETEENKKIVKRIIWLLACGLRSTSLKPRLCVITSDCILMADSTVQCNAWPLWPEGWEEAEENIAESCKTVYKRKKLLGAILYREENEMKISKKWNEYETKRLNIWATMKKAEGLMAETCLRRRLCRAILAAWSRPAAAKTMKMAKRSLAWRRGGEEGENTEAQLQKTRLPKYWLRSWNDLEIVSVWRSKSRSISRRRCHQPQWSWNTTAPALPVMAKAAWLPVTRKLVCGGRAKAWLLKPAGVAKASRTAKMAIQWKPVAAKCRWRLGETWRLSVSAVVKAAKAESEESLRWYQTFWRRRNLEIKCVYLKYHPICWPEAKRNATETLRKLGLNDNEGLK